jgi:hypothetical protein
MLRHISARAPAQVRPFRCGASVPGRQHVWRRLRHCKLQRHRPWLDRMLTTWPRRRCGDQLYHYGRPPSTRLTRLACKPSWTPSSAAKDVRTRSRLFHRQHSDVERASSDVRSRRCITRAQGVHDGGVSLASCQHIPSVKRPSRIPLSFIVRVTSPYRLCPSYPEDIVWVDPQSESRVIPEGDFSWIGKVLHLSRRRRHW